MTTIGSSSVNPYYGINQAGGMKPTDAAKAADKAATEAAVAAASPQAAPEKPDASQYFLDYAKMSVPERIRQKYLEDNHLSEEDLTRLGEKERKKIEDEIKLAIEEAVKKGMREAGSPVDSVSSVGNIANILV